jgi:hypothetical protein
MAPWKKLVSNLGRNVGTRVYMLKESIQNGINLPSL